MSREGLEPSTLGLKGCTGGVVGIGDWVAFGRTPAHGVGLDYLGRVAGLQLGAA